MATQPEMWRMKREGCAPVLFQRAIFHPNSGRIIGFRHAPSVEDLIRESLAADGLVERDKAATLERPASIDMRKGSSG